MPVYEFLIPLGSLRPADLRLKHYVVWSYGRPWVLTAREESRAVEAAVLTVPVEHLRCVPELAAAGREHGVAEMPWTRDLRATRASETLRYAFPLDFLDVADSRSIVALLDACAELFHDAPETPTQWTIRFTCEGQVCNTTLKVEGIARAVVCDAVERMSLHVFADEDAVRRYDESDEVHFLSVLFSRIPEAAVAAVRDYQPLPGALVAGARGSLFDSVDDLECLMLAAIAHAVATVRRDGLDATRVHLFAAAEMELQTRVLDAREDQP
jgi:hypothetical protein